MDARDYNVEIPEHKYEIRQYRTTTSLNIINNYNNWVIVISLFSVPRC